MGYNGINRAYKLIDILEFTCHPHQIPICKEPVLQSYEPNTFISLADTYSYLTVFKYSKNIYEDQYCYVKDTRLSNKEYQKQAILSP